MRPTPRHIALLCALLAQLSAAAIAVAQSERESEEQTAPPKAAEQHEEVIVIVESPRPSGVDDLRGPSSEHANAEEGLDASGFATLVRVQESEGERRTVGEALARTIGVSVRSLGGLGAFTSISVRGADPGHTSVSVDGLPLSRIASVSADLGQFDLGSFETLALYRGAVPTALGGAGVGGAVDMRTALGPGSDGKSLAVSAGLGSHGARHMRARWLGGQRAGDRAYHLALAYAGADGDFEFFDDGATPLNPDDDRTSVRQNNAFDRLALLGRARLGSLTLGSRTSVQLQGLPGGAHDQASVASLSTAHELVDARYEEHDVLVDDSLLRGRGFASLERQHFSDPADEIGLLAQDSVYRTTSTGLGGDMLASLTESHRLEATLDARLDWFRSRPRETPAMGSAGNRQGLALALSDRMQLAGDRLSAILGLRLDGMRTRPSRDVFSATGGSEPAVRRWYASPRASLRQRIGDDLAIKSSVGRYLRVPTLVEMFGDRGAVLGNSELSAEVGLTGDLGLVWAPWQGRGRIDRIYVEAVAFASQADRPIVFVNRGGLVAQAINLEGARIMGTELMASMRVHERVTLSSHYSFLDARNRASGAARNKQLPGRPRHRWYGRVDAAFRPRGHLVVLWGDALRSSGNYVDELNIFELPARALLGAGLKVALVRDLLLGFEIKNATDRRSELVALDPPPSEDLQRIPRTLSDVHGYPLPGRSLYLNLHWKH